MSHIALQNAEKVDAENKSHDTRTLYLGTLYMSEIPHCLGNVLAYIQNM